MTSKMAFTVWQLPLVGFVLVASFNCASPSDSTEACEDANCDQGDQVPAGEGCASDPCGDGVACRPLPAPSTGYQCGGCEPGFRDVNRDGSECVRIVVTPPDHTHDLGGPDSDYVHGHSDSVPNFGKAYTVINSRDGKWSDAGTWSTGELPGPGAIIRIAEGTTVTYDSIAGDVATIGIEGRLTFATDTSTRLRVGNLLVYRGGTLEVGTTKAPVAADVTAEIVIANQPLDLTDDGTGVFDPEQWGTGLLNFGTVQMHGRSQENTFLTVATEPRAGDTALTLASSSESAGWRVGDRLLIPDTVDRRGEAIEEPTIAAIDGTVVTLTAPLAADHPGARDVDGTLDILPHVINMTRNVVVRSEYTDLPEDIREGPMNGTRGHTVHFGTADIDVRYVAFRDLGRTRNLPLDLTTFAVDLQDSNSGTIYTVEVGGGVVRDTQSVLPKQYRAYVDHGVVRVKDASRQPVATVSQLGEWRLLKVGTNQIARYPVHAHHVRGIRRDDVTYAGYQYKFIGNAIDGGSLGKWGFVIHSSHFGLIYKNIVYDVQGAGFVTEGGDETGNVFENNFAIKVQFHTGSTSQSKHGLSGDGFWFRGNGSYVIGNVATNLSSFGYTYFNQQPKSNARTRHGVMPELGRINIPLFRGANPSHAAEADYIDGETQVIAQFLRNGAYAAHTGINLWTLSMPQGANGGAKVDRDKRNLLLRTKLWHMASSGIFTYGARHLTVDDFVFRGRATGIASHKKRLMFSGVSRGSALRADGVAVKDGLIRNADIQGVMIGIEVGENLGGATEQAGTMRVENTYIRAHVGMVMNLKCRAGVKHELPRYVRVANTTFDPLVPPQFVYHPEDEPAAAFVMHYERYEGGADATVLRPDTVHLANVTVSDGYADDGRPWHHIINDARTYFVQQAPRFRMPKTYTTEKTGMLYAAPVNGLTNAEAWATYGIAMAGSVAACEDTVPGVIGFVCEGAMP